MTINNGIFISASEIQTSKFQIYSYLSTLNMSVENECIIFSVDKFLQIFKYGGLEQPLNTPR